VCARITVITIEVIWCNIVEYMYIHA